MKHNRLILTLLAFILFCPTVRARSVNSDYWPESVSDDQIHSVRWSLDPADLGSLSVLSVSPSGQYIAAADRSMQNIEKRHAADVANPLGRLPDAIFLFSRDGEHYSLFREFPVDTDTQLELSSLLGGGSALVWNEEETRIIITSDWGMTSEVMGSAANFHSNMYMMDISDGSFRCLTENEQPCEHCVLPQWVGPDAVRYARIANNNNWQNTLCEMDLGTGEEKELAGLYSAQGRICPILSWQIVGQQIYYTVDAFSAQTGFFESPLGGKEKDARCLVDLFAELRETKKHPYGRALTLGRQGISPDGKWACLTVNDPRVMNRDIPLSDDPKMPQDDPANAVSLLTGQPWVPCHDILLFDLEAGKLVDPFAGGPLDPAKVIVTGACFAPDGQSLLCAVFGDGGPWTIGDFTRTTFYQVNLADGDFTAVRVFETELASSVWFADGLRWLPDHVLCIPTGTPPLYPVQMMQPAVFAQYP